MINHHPTDCTLVKFSEGTLGPSDSLVVSAHCDMCSKCQDKVDAFIENLALKVFDDKKTDNTVSQSLVDMFGAITSNQRDLQNAGSNPSHSMHLDAIQYELQKYTVSEFNDGRYLVLDGRRFELPDTLCRYNVKASEWSKLVGKLWQSQVEIGGGYLAQFIYMEKGGSVPEHTHRGNELTLVIDGEFSDGLNKYETGDFIALNSKHKHVPSTQSNEGCLVFSIIDQPLHFTSGWAKLVNPLSHLYFKVNTR